MTRIKKEEYYDLNDWRCFFEKSEILKAIDLQADQTREWMSENKESFSADGYLKKGSPWWTIPPVTDDEILIEGRKQLLRDRTYEHGILHFMLGLNDKEIVKFSPDSEEVSILTNNTTPKVINQLMMFSRANLLVSSITLTKLSEFYCYANGAKNRQVRDRYLIPMAPLGIFSTYVKTGYSIKIGPVAETFYKKVYFPTIKQLTVNHDEG